MKHDYAREKVKCKICFKTLLIYKRIRNLNNPWKTLQEVENSFWNSSHITFTLYGTSYRTSNTMSCIVIVTDIFLAFVSIFWSSENLWWNMIHYFFTITSQIEFCTVQCTWKNILIIQKYVYNFMSSYLMQNEKEKNEYIIIYQMKAQPLGKVAIISVWGKLTLEVDEEWEKMSSSCWVHVKVQQAGRILSYSQHSDSSDGAILQVPWEIWLILKRYHCHCCLLVQMEWGTSGHKAQPSHSVCAVECGTNGMVVLRVKLKSVVLNGTDFEVW